ncbi:MAG: DNA polymerase (family X) [Candidatus Peregrinibacteria bacterium Gr01-1014_25]|nr:MAG: DNA polymerase (family X) [Candidatus Peregrinibacteria bacterium Gr01-1014_25]
MTNGEIAAAFERIALLLELKGENPFRVRAYERAAQMITAHPREMRDLHSHGGVDALKELPGIGEDLADKIAEMVTTGRLVYATKLQKEFPEGLLAILDIEGIGPKKAKLLWQKFRVRSIDELETLAQSGKLEKLKGWGPTSVRNILRGIGDRRTLRARLPLPKALELAEELCAALARSKMCNRLEIAGSLRRRKETIGDIDLLATSRRPEEVMDAFCALPAVQRVIGRGPTKASVLLRSGVQADLRVVDPAVFGAALHYFTGGKEHNVIVRTMARKRGITISEYGAFRGSAERKGKLLASRTEEDIFAAVGLPWIAPELREGRGEIEAAQKDALPSLITEDAIRGDMHVHTDFSDGTASAVAMAKAAKAVGYDYIAITDHASPMGMVRGIKTGNIDAYLTMIDDARRRVPGIHILAGAEVDILPDGRLYLPDSVLAKLDWVVASIHQAFRQSRAEMTKRVLRAVAHPNVHLLGHPTARLLGQRTGIDIDMEAVLHAAKKQGIAVEHNASPERLDLPDVFLRRAKELGVPVCIDSDAHDTDGYDKRFGISQARRGWLEAGDVFNAWTWKEANRWMSQRRSKSR